MHWLTFCVLITALCNGGGVTQTSGIEQFWTDDYKIFEQVYGKTSDKEIYGVTLPPNIGHELDNKHRQASEKNERYYHNGDESDNYNVGVKDLLRYNKLKSTLNFKNTNDFKPISQNSDPETYFYLKHLENLDEQEKKEILQVMPSYKPYLDSYEPEGTDAHKSIREKKKKVQKIKPNFKPSLDSYEPNPEDTDAYKSIQELLHAHEANKGKGGDANSKYLTYREKSKPKKIPSTGNKTSKPRCIGARCGFRPSYRSRPRPYYRIKKRVVY